jgi:hypothetical protein
MLFFVWVIDDDYRNFARVILRVFEVYFLEDNGYFFYADFSVRELCLFETILIGEFLLLF